MRTAGNRKTGTLLVLIWVVLACGVAGSFTLIISQIRDRYEKVAINNGRTLFRAIVGARRWNADHGGVYVPITDRTLPNPYLEDPLRDLSTREGIRLTKINPAYMTRQFGEYMKEEGIAVHITSLNPIRPGNEPDEWERSALETFEKGSREEHVVEGSGEAARFRYIGALVTEAKCLRCHAMQGYKEGDVRGGISLSTPYATLAQAAALSYREAAISHGLFLILGSAILLFLGRKIVRSVADLETSLATIRKLEGILPICSNCKKIRREEQNPREQKSWVPVDSYIADHTEATFSHGICPECMEALYGEELADRK